MNEVPGIVARWRGGDNGFEAGPADCLNTQPGWARRSMVGGLRFAPDSKNVGQGRHLFCIAARNTVLERDDAPSRRPQPQQERSLGGQDILSYYRHYPRPTDATSRAGPRGQ